MFSVCCGSCLRKLCFCCASWQNRKTASQSVLNIMIQQHEWCFPPSLFLFFFIYLMYFRPEWERDIFSGRSWILNAVLVHYQMQTHVLSHQTHCREGGGGRDLYSQTKHSPLLSQDIFKQRWRWKSHRNKCTPEVILLPMQSTFKAEWLDLNGILCSG